MSVRVVRFSNVSCFSILPAIFFTSPNKNFCSTSFCRFFDILREIFLTSRESTGIFFRQSALPGMLIVPSLLDEFVCVCMKVCFCLSVYLCVSCVCVCACACANVCVRVRGGGAEWACMGECVGVYVYVYVCVCGWLCLCVRVRWGGGALGGWLGVYGWVCWCVCGGGGGG